MSKIEIRKISVEKGEEWRCVGKQAYMDRPEFQEENVLWPEIYRIPEEDKGFYLLAELRGEAVGRLVLQSASSSGIILDVCVMPSFRRMGVGKKLLNAAIGEAKKWKKKEVNVMGYIDEEDLISRSFFHSHGFMEKEIYSVLIDLRKPFPSSALEKDNALYKEGFILRKLQAVEQDIILAAELQEKYFPTFPGYIPVRDLIQHIMKKSFIILIIEKNSQPAGFVIGAADCTTQNYRHTRRKGEGLLTSIAVCEDFRGKGVASALVLGLMTECKKMRNEAFLYGGCGMNTPSMQLAQNCGGERLRKHYGMALKLMLEF